MKVISNLSQRGAIFIQESIGVESKYILYCKYFCYWNYHPSVPLGIDEMRISRHHIVNVAVDERVLGDVVTLSI